MYVNHIGNNDSNRNNVFGNKIPLDLDTLMAVGKFVICFPSAVYIRSNISTAE
jgi:hypothetical protein